MRQGSGGRASGRKSASETHPGVVDEVNVGGIEGQPHTVADGAGPRVAASLAALVLQRGVNAARLGADGQAHLRQQVSVPRGAQGSAVGEGSGIRLLNAVLIVIEPAVGGDGEAGQCCSVVGQLPGYLLSRPRRCKHCVQARLHGERGVKVRALEAGAGGQKVNAVKARVGQWAHVGRGARATSRALGGGNKGARQAIGAQRELSSARRSSGSTQRQHSGSETHGNGGCASAKK